MKTTSGLENTLVADTKLSLVDGLQGRLIIQGRHLEDFARMTFEEAAESLWGKHPRSFSQDKEKARRALTPMADHLHQRPPMEGLRLGLAALPNRFDQWEIAAAFPILLGFIKMGAKAPAPDQALSYSAEILRQATEGTPEAEKVRALDTYLVTVSEHGMNASTFCGRVTCSTGATRVDSTLAALSALSGPLHGGAPGPVLDLLDELTDRTDIKERLTEKVRAGERLMGFGHRVYRTRDPRAQVLQKAIRSLCPSESLLHAENVERLATEVLADLKPHRPLHTNVEFYTAVLLHELGFERSWFTTLFASGRILGWMAHFDEQVKVGKLLRPKARYVGPLP